MTTTVIGLFGGTEEARDAARAIAGTGHAKQEPQLLGPDGGEDVGEELTRRGFDLEDAEGRRGGNAGETTLEVVQEEASVRKQGVSQGAVRVSRRVTERPFRETVTLTDRHVEVEERSAWRDLSDAEAEGAFQETTEEFVESSERAVVRKTAKVVGEVVVSQEAVEREETVEGTVRRADVAVERLRAAGGDGESRR